MLWGGSSGNTTWQLHLQCQEGLKARARTVSESSTVSLEDDSRPSSESVSEDAAEELASAEAVKLDEDKVSMPELM